MSDLEAAAEIRDGRHRKQMTLIDQNNLKMAYANASSRLIILDYDGTLKDFVPSPRALLARPSLRLRRILKRLSADNRNHLAIVSGRPKKALERWFRGLNITLVAEHGAWTRYEGKWSKVDSDFNHVKKQLKPILEKYASRTAGAEVEEKDYSLVWHYRNVVPELAYVRANELKRELVHAVNDEEVGVFSGEKVVEIKPIDINKGHAVDELSGMYPSEFILAAGDDYTDEDMFHTLPRESYTIKVGTGRTKARHQLRSVTDITRLLEELSQQ